MGKGAKATGQKSKPLSQKNRASAEAKVKSSQQRTNDGELRLPVKVTTHTIPPPGWPSKLPYLPVALEAPNLTPLHRAMISMTTPPALAGSDDNKLHTNTMPAFTADSTTTTAVVFSPTSNPLIQIRSINDPNHPAHQQSGLFAAKNLAPGTHIVDYTGLIHICPQPSCATSDYDLAFLDRDASLAIDSAEMGNEARFVNDYHGIRAEGPNAVFEEYYVRVKSAKVGREVWQARMGIWVKPVSPGKAKGRAKGKGNESRDGKGKGRGNEVAKQRDGKEVTESGIAKGEEICVSYGKGWWRARRGMMEEEEEGEEGKEDDDEKQTQMRDDEGAT